MASRLIASRAISPLLSLIAAALFAISCKPPDQKQRRNGPPSVAEICASDAAGTKRLGDAIASVRIARLFATRDAQRLALAKLEPLLIRQLQLEPDSVTKAIAWMSASDTSRKQTANEEILEIVNRTLQMQKRYGAKSVREFEIDSYDWWYRDNLQSVLDKLSPHDVDGCRQRVWQEMFAAALEAQAR